MDCAKTTARRNDKHLGFGILCSYIGRLTVHYIPHAMHTVWLYHAILLCGSMWLNRTCSFRLFDWYWANVISQMQFGRVMHTIIWINAGILLIGPLQTNFREFLIKHFHWKWRLKNGGHFVSASMYQVAPYIWANQLLPNHNKIQQRDNGRHEFLD